MYNTQYNNFQLSSNNNTNHRNIIDYRNEFYNLNNSYNSYNNDNMLPILHPSQLTFHPNNMLAYNQYFNSTMNMNIALGGYPTVSNIDDTLNEQLISLPISNSNTNTNTNSTTNTVTNSSSNLTSNLHKRSAPKVSHAAPSKRCTTGESILNKSFNATDEKISNRPASCFDNSNSCHQCKTKKESYRLVVCTQSYKLKTNRESTRHCHKKFCIHCLEKYYNIIDQGVKLDTEYDYILIISLFIISWICPCCNNKCSCATCKRSRERKELKDIESSQPLFALATVSSHLVKQHKNTPNTSVIPTIPQTSIPQSPLPLPLPPPPISQNLNNQNQPVDNHIINQFNFNNDASNQNNYNQVYYPLDSNPIPQHNYNYFAAGQSYLEPNHFMSTIEQLNNSQYYQQPIKDSYNTTSHNQLDNTNYDNRLSISALLSINNPVLRSDLTSVLSTSNNNDRPNPINFVPQ